MKVEIGVTTYEIKYLPRKEYQDKWGDKTHAITIMSGVNVEDANYIYFSESATFDIIIHELIHALIHDTNFYSDKLPLDEKEELVCQLIGDNFILLKQLSGKINSFIKRKKKK